MRINVQCSTAVHILLIVAMMPEDFKVTSDFIAGSVGCNAVEIRKIFGSLKKAGILDVSRGPGGARLVKEPSEISLLDIYEAVDPSSLDELIGIQANSSKHCPFGKNIVALLTESYAEIGDAVRAKMEAVNLEKLINRLKEIEPSFAE